jgi:hypothetical protein
LSLRESYRHDLREVKKITKFRYVRFHAIFHDEVGVYDEDEQGHPLYNFSYVDQIYDGLLQNGIRPFAEISFVPKKLAAREAIRPFWYQQNVAPPKDYAKWDDLIQHFGRHLVGRYGIEEVSQRGTAATKRGTGVPPVRMGETLVPQNLRAARGSCKLACISREGASSASYGATMAPDNRRVRWPSSNRSQ